MLQHSHRSQAIAICQPAALRRTLRFALALLLLAGMLAGPEAGEASPAAEPKAPATEPEAPGSILTVNTAADVFDVAGQDCSTVTIIDLPGAGGSLSLREAICASNNTPDGEPHAIWFAIGSGARTITLDSPLPAITRPVFIDGTTQPGYAGLPLIALDGINAGSDGLRISAGSTTLQGLSIQRFGGAGVRLEARGFNTILGNHIGVDLTGSQGMGNGRGGVHVAWNSPYNTIGSPNPGEGNLISANLGNGIYLASKGNTVQGNRIGVDRSGAAALPNQRSGVVVFKSDWNLIGGWSSGEGNLISANLEAGLVSDRSRGVQVVGNTIGANAAGTAALGNGQNGVILKSNSWTILEDNLISGNDGFGVYARGVDSIYLEDNRIGTNALGSAALPNQYGGVWLIDAWYSDIGWTQGNLISANGGPGLFVTGGQGNDIVNNKIGVDAGGSLPLGNASDGILLWNSPGNTLGGEFSGQGNHIAANGGWGVRIYGDAADGNRLFANQIGLGANGATLGNALDGVMVMEADRTLIGVDSSGGSPLGLGNVIAHNHLAGVVIAGQAEGNRVARNAIFDNRRLGIDLGANGVVEGIDYLDADTGANLLQNFPVLTLSANPTPSLSLAGVLHSAPNTAYSLDFYATALCDGLYHGEGQQWLGSLPADTDSGGAASFNFDLGAPLPAGMVYVTATATDPDGNTSEFSACSPQLRLVFLPFVRR